VRSRAIAAVVGEREVHGSTKPATKNPAESVAFVTYRPAGISCAFTVTRRGFDLLATPRSAGSAMYDGGPPVRKGVHTKIRSFRD